MLFIASALGKLPLSKSTVSALALNFAQRLPPTVT